MRYDTIIIGGGLSGLIAGITLASAGKRVCIVSAGQSSLHSNSGSFDLLGYDNDGKAIEHLLETIASLNDQHPYKEIGTEKTAFLANKAKALLDEAGIKTTGDSAQDHYRFTPLGTTKPAWLTTEGYAISQQKDSLPWKSVELLNTRDFLDSPTVFIAANLKKSGVTCQMKSFTTDELSHVRKSPIRMRVTNIAKVSSDKVTLCRVADRINAISGETEVLLLPAVLGFNDNEGLNELKAMVKKPIEYLATLPPSVSGIRTTHLLRQLFGRLGGTILVGDTANNGVFEGNRFVSITTENLPNEFLYADEFILAFGSFMSHGLQSNYQHVFEPVFSLNVDDTEVRSEWTEDDAFVAQSYMEYGMQTDKDFHTIKDGKTISNLFVIGSLSNRHNNIKLADGTGVSLLTALQVTKIITERKQDHARRNTTRKYQRQ